MYKVWAIVCLLFPWFVIIFAGATVDMPFIVLTGILICGIGILDAVTKLLDKKPDKWRR